MSAQINPATDPDFALEPSDGNIPERVITELRSAYSIAKDYAQSYSDAAKAQAELYKLKPGALKRYIAALENDSTDDLKAEASDIEKLLA
jgi:hypothetical protein